MSRKSESIRPRRLHYAGSVVVQGKEKGPTKLVPVTLYVDVPIYFTPEEQKRLDMTIEAMSKALDLTLRDGDALSPDEFRVLACIVEGATLFEVGRGVEPLLYQLEARRLFIAAGARELTERGREAYEKHERTSADDAFIEHLRKRKVAEGEKGP